MIFPEVLVSQSGTLANVSTASGSERPPIDRKSQTRSLPPAVAKSSPLGFFPRDIRLRDGRKLRLRPFCSGDRELLSAFFARCSSEAIRYRFLSSMKSVPESLLDYLADSDGSTHVALILTQREADEEMIVAEGRYVVFNERQVI